MPIKYKFLDVAVYNERICLKTSFLISKWLSGMVILETSFLSLLYPFKVLDNEINKFNSKIIDRKVLTQIKMGSKWEGPRGED